MAAAKTIALIDRVTWILIFAGLITLVLGLATLSHQAATGWSLIAVGAVATLVGVVLIWIRSRLNQTG